MDVSIKPQIASPVPQKNDGKFQGPPKATPVTISNRVPEGPENVLARLEATYGEKKLKAIGIIECVTCAERRYVDGSNDGSVSFKTPGKISPEASAAVVMSHEMEHVSNEKASAAAEDREIISQSVTLQSAICPECGKSYVSGGTTRTVTKGTPQYEPSEELLKGVKFDQKL
jgi:hypothetical protein